MKRTTTINTDREKNTNELDLQARAIDAGKRQPKPNFLKQEKLQDQLPMKEYYEGLVMSPDFYEDEMVSAETFLYALQHGYAKIDNL